MKRAILAILGVAFACAASATILVNQTPAANGGTMRWSKLWIDPSGLGNDLDSDAICYEDFTLTNDATIEHMEWWGAVNPNLGFQIEFWRQDPGTIAYQPLAVFRTIGAQPEAAFTTTSYATAVDPSGTTHFSWDLPTPVSLSKNNAANPRWFVAIIGLTNQAPVIWTWAQGLGGSPRTFWWVRADGNTFHVLPEGRALLLSGTAVPEPAGILALCVGLALIVRHRR